MRLASIILFAWLIPVAGGYCAEDSGERNYPTDRNTECLERNVNSASGGCITREDGSARNDPPQALPPAPDTSRRSPPESEAAPPSETPSDNGETR